MLVVKNLSKSFSNRLILKDINFLLKKGEVVALLGPNGDGKTTLMRCLCGFYDFEGGSIQLDGYDLKNQRKIYLQNLSYVCESGGLYSDMSVWEYFSFMASVKNIDAVLLQNKLSQLIKIFDLEVVLKQKCETLSKGYKRRVAIVGALLNEPEVLLLDEPTEGLDPVQKQQLRVFLKDYGRNHIVLVSTHIMEEVDALADRVLMVVEGKLVYDTTPQNLKKSTKYNTIEESFCALVEN